MARFSIAIILFICALALSQTAVAQFDTGKIGSKPVLDSPQVEAVAEALKNQPSRIAIHAPLDGSTTQLAESKLTVRFSARAKFEETLTAVQYVVRTPEGGVIKREVVCRSDCGNSIEFQDDITLEERRNGNYRLAIQIVDSAGQIIDASSRFELSPPLFYPLPGPVLFGPRVREGYKLVAQTDLMTPHPRLAPLSSIHFDHYNSSVSDAPIAEFDRFRLIPKDFDGGTSRNGACLNFMEDNRGNLIGFCGDRDAPLQFRQAEYQITLFDKETFSKLDKITIAEDIKLKSHGCYNASEDKAPLYLGYFVMDNHGRALVTKDNNVTYFIRASDDGRRLETVDEIRFSDLQLPGMRPDFRLHKKRNRVAQILPDHGSGYWFMGQGTDRSAAFVGHITADKRVDFFQWLNHGSNNELIENGMAIDESGLYVLSDHALYKFSYESGNGRQVFRETYQRASEDRCKKGTMAHRGSGSTPTLLGPDLIAFTDNADVQVNVVVMDRRDRPGAAGRRICEVPVFSEYRSANENSLIGYNNSLIVQNWFGAPDKITWDTRLMRPGVWRVDVDADRTSCSVVWRNDTIASTATARLSTKTGLIYMPVERWRAERLELAALDFATGEEAHPRMFMGNITRDEISDDFPDDEQILMLPIYVLLSGEMVQPVFAGVKRVVGD